MASIRSQEYYRELLKRPAFGATGFNLDELRTGMATRPPPTISDVNCFPSQMDGIPGEWEMAPGADPDLRLLYPHGGGYVSGSGAFYLAMAAHVLAAPSASSPWTP